MSTNKLLFGMFLYVLVAIVLGSFVVHSIERYADSHVLMKIDGVIDIKESVANVIYIVRDENNPMYNPTSEYDVYLLQHVGTKSANGNWIYEFGSMWDWGGDFMAQGSNSAEYDLAYEVVCTKAGLEKPEEIGIEVEKANHKNSISFRVGDKMPKSFVLSCR